MPASQENRSDAPSTDSETRPARPHTPGPWFVSPDDPLLVLAPDGDREPWEVCRAEDFCGETSDEVANARLIASAPELLAEARELCAILDNYAGHDGETLVYDFEAIGEEVSRRHKSLTAAIAKAEGR